jgi:hypothetical protein
VYLNMQIDDAIAKCSDQALSFLEMDPDNLSRGQSPLALVQIVLLRWDPYKQRNAFESSYPIPATMHLSRLEFMEMIENDVGGIARLWDAIPEDDKARLKLEGDEQTANTMFIASFARGRSRMSYVHSKNYKH